MRNHHHALVLAGLMAAVAETAFCQGVIQPQLAPNAGVTAGRVADAASLPLTLPYTMVDGMMLVKVSISDSPPHDAIIATAIPITVVSPSIVSKDHLKTEGILDIPTLYGSVRGGAIKPLLLHLDKLAITDVSFGVYDLRAHLSKHANPEAPGIWLGGNVLGAAAFTIDPDKNEVTFRSTLATPSKKAIQLPFEIKDGLIYVDIKVDGKKTVSMLLDTASQGTLLPSDVGKGLKLTTSASMRAIHPNGKECTVTSLALPEIALGQAKVKAVQALYISSGDTAGLNTGPGVLGTDVLLRYKVTISYATRKLILEPRAGAEGQKTEQKPGDNRNPSGPARIDPRRSGPGGGYRPTFPGP